FLLIYFVSHGPVASLHLHSFPTRRSSDLQMVCPWKNGSKITSVQTTPRMAAFRFWMSPSCRRKSSMSLPLSLLVSSLKLCSDTGDRKSTRLNSSHVKISYAVFCLKKKKYT